MDKPEDRKEYIKTKKRKYGENWREHIKKGVPFKKKQPPEEQQLQYPRNRKQREGGLDPSDITENLQQMKPEPIRPPQAKGIRKALRGGGRAYGQNS